MADAAAAGPSTSDAADPADPAEFDAAYMAEMADFHMALQDELKNAGERMIRHLGTLRAMAAEPIGGADAAALRRELHAAAATKAREWVEQRAQQLVAEFHLRWHEDADLLAVDRALREGVQLVSEAEGELGALPVSHEVLGACEAQLRGQLRTHVRRANRHELRMLYADFCGRDGRDELQALCLEKYREQVDKHVQTEAVKTQMRLQAMLDARDAASKLAQSAATPAAAAQAAPTQGGAQQHGDGSNPVGVLSDYLEGVAGLGEELTAAGLPSSFVASVLREVEEEVSTQALELTSQVRGPPLAWHVPAPDARMRRPSPRFR